MKIDDMSDSKNDIINIVTTGGLLAVFSALVKALFSTEPIATRVKSFIGGSILGTVVFFVLRNVNLQPFYKETLCICFASFATTIFPVIEKKFVNWVKKSDNGITK